MAKKSHAKFNKRMKTLIVEENNNNNDDRKPNGNDSCNGLHNMVNGLIQTRKRKKNHSA